MLKKRANDSKPQVFWGFLLLGVSEMKPTHGNCRLNLCVNLSGSDKNQHILRKACYKCGYPSPALTKKRESVMNLDRNDDNNVLEVLLERLNKQRLPHALALEKKVDSGDILNEYDLEFLEEVVGDLGKVKPIYDRHPDYHSLITKLMGLYTHIIQQAAKNEASPTDKNRSP